ncbi:hypothetical protein B0A50_02444 [Salinomyces thailandicus]|uniref:S-adenosyl-L-methionine-dependent methyltransferase n=1 Tax=Salinomyces thailandicus TaxID=706561 RepID=A0A4U0U6V5_9PEZI|nr:hypothetical protein B0A50_02444 [Salinomyces thailandica]
MAKPDQDVRERLRQHFADLPPEDQAGAWNAMWQQNITPWDRGLPNPALIDTLTNLSGMLGRPFKDPDDPSKSPRRKKALVPGCGRGYDVLLLAAAGYNAYGLDTSTLAISSAQDLANEPDRDSKYAPAIPSEEGGGRGEAEFLEADFFKDAFLAHTDGGEFDIIYDYTFLCALPPALRPAWAKRMSDLLSPTGHLICLEFPLKKEPRLGGPPHGLTCELYEQLLKQPGTEVKYDSGGYVIVEEGGVGRADGALTRVARWKAERTHEVGKGGDYVSVWMHLR